MAGRKKVWRRAFLGRLRRTGNVRASAAFAGIDPGTAYDHQKKDARFAARWETALAQWRAEGPLHRLRRSPSPANAGEEMVARRSKGGVQMVRAAPGRWSGKVQAGFLAELKRTGNVAASARAARISTTALYRRRENYPAFAADWAAAEAWAKERIPRLLTAASIAALDAEVDGEGLPPVSIGEAIRIAQLKCAGGGARPSGGGSALRFGPRPLSIDEVRDDVIGRLAALRAHRERQEKGRGDDGA
jgi:hypothetical protein